MAGICKHSVSLHKTRICLQQPADKAAIDSLEAALNDQYMSHHDHKTIARSDSFGVFIATQVFNWSETDGYLHASDPYTPPTGSGLWVPTPPAFTPPLLPYWGNDRPIIAGSINNTQPDAPIPYSENPSSAFFKMAKHVYHVSKNLTPDQTAAALFWRDGPGYTPSGHWISILQQVIQQTNSHLDKAAFAYALTGVCVSDATISCWITRYHYNVLRPVTYIQNALSSAAAKAFTAIYGDIGSFTDHTYDYMGMAPRTFSSFDAIAYEVSKSRVYAGIHYKPSCDTGIIQGIKVADNIFRVLKIDKEVK